jgi:RHS repeat-associated protein
MAMKVRYTVVDGEVLSELRGGVKRDYVPDPLGSTVALLDSTQTITDTFSYWPYGESAGRTGTTATPFQYVGTMGYYTDSSGRNYVRARYLDKGKGRWITEDPIGFEAGVNLYRYCSVSPTLLTDKSGLYPVELRPGDLISVGLCLSCAHAYSDPANSAGHKFCKSIGRHNDDGTICNAVQHCMWMCLISKNCWNIGYNGVGCAFFTGNWHEHTSPRLPGGQLLPGQRIPPVNDAPNPPNHMCMDLYNNEKG